MASFAKDIALLKFVQIFLYCQQTSIVPSFRRNWTFQIVRPQAIKLSRGLRCSGNLWESVLNCIVTVAVCFDQSRKLGDTIWSEKIMWECGGIVREQTLLVVMQGNCSRNETEIVTQDKSIG